MKHLIPAMLLACASCSPVPAVAIEATGDAVTLSAEDRQTLSTCSTANPCTVWSRAELVALAREIAAKLQVTCRRELSI